MNVLHVHVCMNGCMCVLSMHVCMNACYGSQTFVASATGKYRCSVGFHPSLNLCPLTYGEVQLIRRPSVSLTLIHSSFHLSVSCHSGHMNICGLRWLFVFVFWMVLLMLFDGTFLLMLFLFPIVAVDEIALFFLLLLLTCART